MSDLMQRFRTEIRPRLQEELGLANPMRVPVLKKVTLNMGVGENVANRNAMESALEALRTISGQKPVVCRARVSVASFKIRAGFDVGCKVTLRGRRMYEFVERLTLIALPRQRDFRGLPASGFDRQGNYNMGIREHIIFPEVDYDRIERIMGLDIALTTTARNPDEGQALLRALGFPLRSR